MNDQTIDTAVSLLISEIKTLREICLHAVKTYVKGIHLESTLKSVHKDQRDVLMELLPLDLPLAITIPTLLSDEIYWKRKCIEGNWNYVHFWINGCAWRETFINHYAEEAVDAFLSRKKTFGETTDDLEVLVEHLKKVKVNGYKGNVMDDSRDSCLVSDDISFEVSAGRFFAFFPSLEEVYLNIAPAGYAAKNESEDEMVKGMKLIRDIFSLRHLTRLTVIGFSLKESQITILAEHLRGSLVSHLNLACNLLNDASCGILKDALSSPCLRTLVLTNNCIGNTGVKNILLGLHDGSSLTSLDVSKNFIEDEGGIAVAELLKSKFQLQKLDISFNKLGYQSGMMFKEVILLNRGLICLNLTGNALGKDVGKMFAEAIADNKSIRYFGIEFCGFDEPEEDVIYSRIHRNRNRGPILGLLV